MTESELSLLAEANEQEQQLKQECKELFNHFNHKNVEAIVRATRLSLDAIKRRVFFSRYVLFIIMIKSQNVLLVC